MNSKILIFLFFILNSIFVNAQYPSIDSIPRDETTNKYVVSRVIEVPGISQKDLSFFVFAWMQQQAINSGINSIKKDAYQKYSICVASPIAPLVKDENGGFNSLVYSFYFCKNLKNGVNAINFNTATVVAKAYISFFFKDGRMKYLITDFQTQNKSDNLFSSRVITDYFDNPHAFENKKTNKNFVLEIINSTFYLFDDLKANLLLKQKESSGDW